MLDGTAVVVGVEIAQLGIGPRLPAKDHAGMGHVEAEGGEDDHSDCQSQSGALGGGQKRRCKTYADSRIINKGSSRIRGPL